MSGGLQSLFNLCSSNLCSFANSPCPLPCHTSFSGPPILPQFMCLLATKTTMTVLSFRETVLEEPRDESRSHTNCVKDNTRRKSPEALLSFRFSSRGIGFPPLLISFFTCFPVFVIARFCPRFLLPSGYKDYLGDKFENGSGACDRLRK